MAKLLWNWFWHDRRGVLLFRGLCGWRRLVLDVPIILLSLYAWYLYWSLLPADEQHFFLSQIENPLFAFAILCFFAYNLVLLYLRDHLPPQVSLSSRLLLFVPGRVRILYQTYHGRDAALRLLRTIGLTGFVSGVIGMFWANWDRIRR